MDICYFEDNGKRLAMGRSYCKPEGCAFQRSWGDYKASLAKANARLQSLPEEQQAAIAKKYYRGQMIWRYT